ncbi:MAG: SDR family NAD(P)-dependent oxidoreductase, partial [Verrucomicrobium sp.]
MQSLWNDQEAAQFGNENDLLGLRVYTSRLLGRNPALVLHGGGNTSVKITEKDFFGEPVALCYVKGSGWDLATIERGGFAPVRMSALVKMAELPTMSDEDMVLQQRAAMTNPNAPAASIEAILHAILPFRFVDHTHANAISALTCNAGGEARVQELFGNRVLIVPYVMPGFILAKTVYELIKGRDLKAEGIEGIVLLKHGLFTFHDDARRSYELMIEMVTLAEEYLAAQSSSAAPATADAQEDLIGLAKLRKAVSQKRGHAQLAKLDASPAAVGYSSLANVGEFGTRGPLTPDHSIRTKRAPAFVGEGEGIDAAIQKFADEYAGYFTAHANGQTMLDAAPRFVIWQGKGLVSFGDTLKDAGIVADIAGHTATTVQLGEAVGGWEPLPQKDIFDIEYWDLEQAKLRKGPARKVHQGKVALVTGSAAGIGFACAESLAEQGATVVGLDLNPEIVEGMAKIGAVGKVVNLTDDAAVQAAIADTVRSYGGIDIVVSNAGIFTAGQYLEDLESSNWEKAMAVNLTSHQRLLKFTIPYLKQGISSSIILVGSRNVKAPGPGAARSAAGATPLHDPGMAAGRRKWRR